MAHIKRFIKKYKGKLIHLIVEEYICFILRSLPGLTGMLLRRFFYRFLFANMGRSVLFYTGVYLMHTYGIKCGGGVSINTGALIDGRGGVKIVDNVMIGPYAIIVSSEHEHDRIDVPMNSLNHKMTPVSIEDDVWIGAHVFIKGGVTISAHSIVGAGAVVNMDVPAYGIVAGVPARIVGDRREKHGF